MSIFTQWTQTNEFGEVLGTTRNPSCARTTDVCAFGDYKAPGFGLKSLVAQACHAAAIPHQGRKLLLQINNRLPLLQKSSRFLLY